IGKPLPNRTTIVLTRSGSSIPGVRTISSFAEVEALASEFPGLQIFICGGARVYEQMLPLCSDLYLTLVKRTVEGDAFFPAFEENFALVETIRDEPDFKILRYKNKNLVAADVRRL